jgi:glycosyltransferase involved in cell wall biosynthesis
VLDSLAATRPHVRALHLARNRGQHGAVLVGLALARGRWCVVMDADLQDPPEALPRLLAARDESVAAVFAGRRGRYESRTRLMTSRVFKTWLAWACGVPKDAGIFVLLRRDLVERMVAMRTASPFIVAMIGCSGLSHRSIPVERVPRMGGASSYRGWDRVASAARALRCVVECRWRPAAEPYLAGETLEALGRSSWTSS